MITNSMENQILFNKATECLQENKNEDAVKLFDELLKREPRNVHILNGKGSGLMQAGRIDEAERVFDKSLEIEDNPMAYLNKALIYGHKEDYGNAISCCDKILELYPEFKDVVYGMRNGFVEKMGEKETDEFDSEAQELIERADGLKDEDSIWKGSERYEKIAPEGPEFKKITLWDAWQLYEDAMKKDPKCEYHVTSRINELKNSLMKEFLFFNISMKDDFNPESERDRLKLDIMKFIYLDDNYTVAQVATKQLLGIDENDLDAIDYKGALSFYFDELDEAIECFDRLIENGDEVYSFYGKYNKAFVLRRKAMVTGELEYMVQALDIYDEMLKNPHTFEKVKPYQREILDKLQDFMNVTLL